MSQQNVEKKLPAKAAEGNVDQIRDILFGGQMRDYERRFEELEERMKREAERNRADFNKRLESLELLIKDQGEKHAGQQKKLDAELRAAADASASALEKLGKALRAELSDVDEKHEHSGSNLRERIHKLGNETAESLRQNHDELSALVDRSANSLRDEKVAREELSGFLSEMALRLNRQFDLPKTGKS